MQPPSWVVGWGHCKPLQAPEAALSGVLRPLSGEATAPRTPLKSASGAGRRRLRGGAVAPPGEG
eukprot:596113-Alexandrium_andersonii.AAC.1